MLDNVAGFFVVVLSVVDFLVVGLAVTGLCVVGGRVGRLEDIFGDVDRVGCPVGGRVGRLEGLFGDVDRIGCLVGGLVCTCGSVIRKSIIVKTSQFHFVNIHMHIMKGTQQSTI